MKTLTMPLMAIFLALPSFGTELHCETSSKVARLTAQIVNSNALTNVSLVNSEGLELLSHQGELNSTVVPMDGLSVTQGASLFKIGSAYFYVAPNLTPDGIEAYTKQVKTGYGYSGENAMISNGYNIQLALLCQVR